jgi:hypothetical protein
MHRSIKENIMKYIIGFLIFMMPSLLLGHDMVPTYPKLKTSYMDGLYKATLTVFNKRPEIEYYEIGVFTEEWDSLPFVSSYKIYKIPYLSAVTFDIYIRKEDKDKITYICSISKLKKQNKTVTAVSSRICSKVVGNT